MGYLKHYGILGMKWGVRKDSYYTPVSKVIRSQKVSNVIGGDNYFAKNDSLSGNMSVDDLMDKVVSKVNPSQDRNNCTYCSLAYNVRRMGYDVEAVATNMSDVTTADLALALTNQYPSDVAYDWNLTDPTLGNFFNSDIKLNPKGLMALSDDELRKYGDYVYNVVRYGGDNVAYSGRQSYDPNQDPEVQKKQEELRKLKEILSEEEYLEKLQEFYNFKRDRIREYGQKNADDIFNSLKKYPDGARGLITIGYESGGGHSQAFEIVNGSPVIFDCQVNEKYSSAQEYVSNAVEIKSFASFRLDDKTLNWDLVVKEVKNVGSK